MVRVRLDEWGFGRCGAMAQSMIGIGRILRYVVNFSESISEASGINVGDTAIKVPGSPVTF